MEKVVLITGVSSGIGKATALRLAGKGYTVYGAARRADTMRGLEGTGIRLITMDITDEASVEAGIATIINTEKRIDILINNAGYGSFGALEDVPMSEARYQFEVNVFGMARLIQLVLPYMREQGSGKIINISSIAGKLGQPHGAWYHATKYAVEGLSDSLRMELHQFKIPVVLIEPGAIQTEWNGIARDKLLQVSGHTAYKNSVQKHYKMFEKADLSFSSPPEVIAAVIEKAVLAQNPKTRYVAGSGAHVLLFLHSILPDKWFDKLVLSQLK